MRAPVRLTAIVAIALLSLAACASPTIQPTGPETTMSSLNSDHFITRDAVRMPVKSWRSTAQQPKAVVIAVHGFNDYSNFFSGTGEYLAARAVTSYAYDQRGFGATPATGIWPGVDALVSDLETFIALVRARHPGIPLYLFGESMGGAVVMVTLNKDHGQSFDGAILSAPAVWGRETMPWYQTAALWLSAHTMPKAKLTGQGLKIMASDNIDMLRALGRDPLIIKKTRVDAVYGLTNLMDAALAAAPTLKVPLLILYGKKDQIIPKAPTELMLSRLPETGKAVRKVISYNNGYHMLTRDLQRAVVLEDIGAWIDAR